MAIKYMHSNPRTDVTCVIAPAYGVAELDNLRNELNRISGVKVLGGNKSVGYQISAPANALEKIRSSFNGRITIDEFELLKPL